MKTLDEVINALEICGHDESPKCPYFDTEHWCCCEDHMRSISPLKDDTLHYLREYRDKHEEMLKMEEALGYCEIAEDRPLTWDELKSMEGKPVWVEWTKSEESYWCFVGEWFDDDEMRIYRMGWDYADYIHKTIYTPDIVQAYRKERIDGLSA